MTPTQFVSELSAIRFPNAFNPYSDACPVHDGPDAPALRSAILTQILEAAQAASVDAIWVGRDLGFRGGRRTGMALTDDVHFHDHLARWGMRHKRPTKGQPVPERTAAAVWEMLSHIESRVFLWNVFPLHPHKPGLPFTNRAHNAKERAEGSAILGKLVKLLNPKRIIAIGNDAELATSGFSDTCEIIKVRHPSYGGQTDFIRKITEIYSIKFGGLI